MPVIKTLKNGVWTKVSSFGELATATSSLNGLMSSADKSKLDKVQFPYEVKDLLWTNASPTSTFTPQTVALDLSEYDDVEIYFEMLTSNLRENAIKCRVGTTSIAGFIFGSGGKILGFYRNLVIHTSGIDFNVGYRCTPSADETDNECCIPYQIYGIKKVVS